MSLEQLCIQTISKNIHLYENSISRNIILMRLFLNYQSHNYINKIDCSQIIYKNAFISGLINYNQLNDYAQLYERKNKNKHKIFDYTDIIEYIPIDKLIYTFINFPSIELADKCIQTFQSQNKKILLALVYYIFNSLDGRLIIYNNIKYVDYKRYYNVINYLLQINKQYFIEHKTHLLPYNVNDTYDIHILEYMDINLNEHYHCGRNIFHFSNNNIQLLEIFMKYCGNNKTLVTAKDSNNDTPFYLACCSDKYKSNEECIQLFLKYGASLGDVDNNGVSAFYRIWRR